MHGQNVKTEPQRSHYSDHFWIFNYLKEEQPVYNRTSESDTEFV